MTIDTGSGDDVLNVRGTIANTNLKLHDGNDRIYVSSQANVTQANKLSFDFLPGNLTPSWPIEH